MALLKSYVSKLFSVCLMIAVVFGSNMACVWLKYHLSLVQTGLFIRSNMACVWLKYHFSLVQIESCSSFLAFLVGFLRPVVLRFY